MAEAAHTRSVALPCPLPYKQTFVQLLSFTHISEIQRTKNIKGGYENVTNVCRPETA